MLGSFWLSLSSVLLAGTPSSPSDNPTLAELVKHIIVEKVPLQIEDRKGWGDQVHILSGLHVAGKGLKLRLEKKKKAVNHGLWQHYQISVVDPKNDLVIRFPRWEYQKGKGIDFRMELDARLRGYADFKQYSNGLHIFSAATEGDIDLKVSLDGVIAVNIVPGGWTADVHVTPKVHDMTLEIPNIDIERFGKIKGKLARETGDSFRKMIEKRLQEEEPELVDKINREIAKQWEGGTLRLSVDQVLAGNR